ncbi:unnamed protein product, partial [Acidithrix sp. C25]
VLTKASPVPLLAFIGLDAAAIDLSLGGSLSKNATLDESHCDLRPLYIFDIAWGNW